jgi:8-oxo-dGTP diphosphatase
VNDIPTFGHRIADVEYIPRPGGYAVVTNELGHLALVRTPKGVFLPGGAVEAGETSEEAAIRETMEETGLDIRIRRYLGRADELVYKRSVAAYYRKECDFYAGAVISTVGTGEADHVLEWVSPDAAIEVLTHDSQRWAVRKVGLLVD